MATVSNHAPALMRRPHEPNIPNARRWPARAAGGASR